ncbi:MAG: glycosyltransferase family 9 protein [Desulfobacterales bacterium]|nr:MAG: glycosyltransferase family 9 protein [Desulfobacterales bacterium]
MEEKRLLIVHHGALGDVVLTFPIIIRLKKIYHHIDLLCQIKLGKLAQALHVVDTYFPLESAAFASLFTDAVDPMVTSILCSYQDVAIFSISTQLEHIISKTTGKPVHRIHPRPGIKKTRHVTHHLLSQLIQYPCFGPDDTTPHSMLLADQHPDRRNPQYDPLKIILHPGSGSPTKCWPLSNFIKTASVLRSKGKRVVFILGPAEHFMANELLQQDGNKDSIHLTDSLIELASILKTAGGFVGNDSGVSHLAAFLGLPSVVVFGPSDFVVWRPIGRSVSILKPDLDCNPCFATDNRCNDWKCFDRTIPEMVFDVLMESISRDL